MVSRRSLLRAVPIAAAALTAAPGAPRWLGPSSTSTSADRVPPDLTTMQAAATAVRGFTADLYRTVASTRSGGNVVCAPYSVGLALGMTRAGAGSVTADEMDAVLHAPHPRPSALDSGLNTIDQTLAERYQDGDGTRRPRLTTANALWTHVDLGLRPGFQETLAGYYGAAPHPVDFRDAPEAARQQINTWVSDRTNAKIPELLQSDAVNSDTRLILTNALYLMAAWKYPFTAAATAVEPFTRDDGGIVNVPIMRGPFDRMGYLEGDGWRAVDVPYAGDGLAMAIVMPTRGDLAAVEANLNVTWLGALLAGFQITDVQLRLPRWRFRLPVELRAALGSLGMPTAFTPQADFTGMSTDTALCIDDVVHETFIAVDEKGTEAAAATAVIVRPPSVPQGPQFFVNRPFLYVIHDLLTGVPLFLGRVHDPLVAGQA
ncbi:serpin family protein [Micromonospora sp. WMMD1120]|uniref:serpin family protein n=1 Tax=Micromonospora sp. WMMD1120 TaxID=3016106 RepID=UPI0024166B12|nr:serpin family protein [Micromonospora sp. WMMD1120]MDG4809367.1 serpin family protein [Micromonospora sp. WMMD1120]